MSIYDHEGEWDYGREEYVSSRKAGKPLGAGAPHYPNKSEGALLRRMMQEGQCSEEEVRSRKGNRQKLAAAAKEPMKRGNTDRVALAIKRRARALAKYEGTPIWEAQKKAGLEQRRRDLRVGRW